jgi:hypothetical protein
LSTKDSNQNPSFFPNTQQHSTNLSSNKSQQEKKLKIESQESIINYEPVTDTALASWLHSRGCIVQSSFLKENHHNFLFLKTPKLYELMSLWQQGNILSDDDKLSIECRACFNYERTRRELMRIVKGTIANR